MKKIAQIGSFLLVTGLLTGSVFAHVTVNPREAVVGRGVFTVRVPNEKDVATTAVRLLIPNGVDVGGVAPVSGWTHAEVREEAPAAVEEDGHGGESGRITEITWSGGRIGVGEFLEFPISVLYEGEPGKVAWKAYQTYADGEVVAWDSTSEEHPAPSVDFRSEARLDTVEKAVAKITGNPLAQAASGSGQMLPIVAVLLSVAALAVSLKKK